MYLQFIFLVTLCGYEVSSQILRKSTITDFTAIASGPTSIQLNWNLINEYEVVYYLLIYLPWESRVKISAPATSFSVIGLNISSEYNFKLTGYSFYENSDPQYVTGRTCDDVPSEVTDVKFVSSESHSITMSWKAPISGAPDVYQVSIWVLDGSPRSTDVRELEYKFTGLQTGLAYYVSIAAKNDKPNCGVQISQAVIKGPYTIEPPTITEFTAVGSGPTSIQLNWTVVSGEELLYYYIKYSAVTPRLQVMPPATSFNVEGLESIKEYSFEITGMGILANTNKMLASARTCDGVPSEVTDVKLVTIKATSITMSWKAPLVQNGKADGYHVSVWTPGGQPTGEDVLVMKHEFTGLQPGLSYYVTIAAKNVQTPCGGGTGKEVLKGLYYIQSVNPVPAPRNPTISLARRTAQMQWSPMTPEELLNIMAYNYELVKSNALDVVIEQGTISNTATSVSVFGLDPFTPYQLTVSTIGVYSRNGVTQPFTTPPGIPTAVGSLVANFNADTLAVTWLPPVETYGKLGKYRCTLYNGNNIETQIDVSDAAHSFLKLLPKTYYAVSVEASFVSVNTLGGGYGPAVKTELMQYGETPEVIGTPNLLSLKSLGATQVRVEWETPENWQSIYQYSIVFDGSEGSKTTCVASFPTHSTVTGLNSSTKYIVKMRGLSMQSAGLFSKTRPITTVKGVPSVVRDLVGKQTKFMSVTLTWSPPITGNPSKYRFFWTNGGNTFHAQGECKGTLTSFLLEPVPANLPITCFVQAYKAPGSGGLGGGYGSMASTPPIIMNGFQGDS